MSGAGGHRGPGADRGPGGAGFHTGDFLMEADTPDDASLNVTAVEQSVKRHRTLETFLSDRRQRADRGPGADRRRMTQCNCAPRSCKTSRTLERGRLSRARPPGLENALQRPRRQAMAACPNRLLIVILQKKSMRG